MSLGRPQIENVAKRRRRRCRGGNYVRSAPPWFLHGARLHSARAIVCARWPPTRPDGGVRPMRFRSVRRMHDSFRRWGFPLTRERSGELVKSSAARFRSRWAKLRTLISRWPFDRRLTEVTRDDEPSAVVASGQWGGTATIAVKSLTKRRAPATARAGRVDDLPSRRARRPGGFDVAERRLVRARAGDATPISFGLNPLFLDSDIELLSMIGAISERQVGSSGATCAAQDLSGDHGAALVGTTRRRLGL